MGTRLPVLIGVIAWMVLPACTRSAAKEVADAGTPTAPLNVPEPPVRDAPMPETHEESSVPVVRVGAAPERVLAGGLVLVVLSTERLHLVDPAQSPTDVAGEGHYRIYLAAPYRTPYQRTLLAEDYAPQVLVRIPPDALPGAYDLIVLPVTNRGQEIIGADGGLARIYVVQPAAPPVDAGTPGP